MTDNQNDEFEIPEGEAEAEGFASQSNGRGLSVYAKIAMGFGFIAVVFVGSLYLNKVNVQQAGSDLDTPPALDATPGGANQDLNPRLQALLEENNDEQSERALNEGRTFLPTPESRLRPISDLDEDQVAEVELPVEEVDEPEPVQVEPVRQPVVTYVPPAPPVRTRQNVETSNPNQQEAQQNPYLDSIKQQMGMISGVSPVRIMAVADPLQNTNVTGEEDVASADADAAGQGTSSVTDAVIIPAGQVLYAETLTSSSSDLPGPVLIEVTTGDFKGSRLIGSFSVGDQDPRMIVQFNTMTLPNGQTISVNAYAVDGYSAETAVRSDIDRRYVARYGPILAATFLTGYATAASATASTVSELGDGTIVTNDASTERQSIMAGVSAAAQAIGADMVSNAPTGPEVKLRSGWPIGILFVADVTGTAASGPGFTQETARAGQPVMLSDNERLVIEQLRAENEGG